MDSLTSITEQSHPSVYQPNMEEKPPIQPKDYVRRQLSLPPNLSHSLMIIASARKKYEKGLNVNDLIVQVLQNYVQMPAIQKELMEAIK